MGDCFVPDCVLIAIVPVEHGSLPTFLDAAPAAPSSIYLPGVCSPWREVAAWQYTARACPEHLIECRPIAFERNFSLHGVHVQVAQILSSWLAPRLGSVVVNGALYAHLTMQYMVYQGTVFGPPMWNLHYAGAIRASQVSGHGAIWALSRTIHRARATQAWSLI